MKEYLHEGENGRRKVRRERRKLFQETKRRVESEEKEDLKSKRQVK